MDTRSFRKIGFEAVNGFKKNGLMRKTVANLVTVFFIATGIPAPTSFAGTNALLGSGASNNTRTITLVEANARSGASSAAVPSGVAVQTSSPLSRTSAVVTAYDPSQNTVLPNRPSVGSGVGSTDGIVSGTLQAQQSSSKNIQVQYSDLDPSDYGYVCLSSGTRMDLRNGITLGMNGASGAKLKMQLKDASGNVATFLLTLQGTMNSYTILGSYLQGLDATKITEVTFVVEPSRMGTSGSFAIETAGLAYVPTIPSDPALKATDVTTLAEVHHVYSIADMNGATASLVQQSASLYTLSYSMSQPGNWAVGLTAFDDYGSPGVVETRDLGSMNRLVMGLRLASGYGDVKIEFEDVNRNKAIVYLDAVGMAEKFYAIGTDLLRAEYPGFDLQHVLNINVVVEKNNVSQPAGQLQVRLGGHPYTPIVSGTFYDQSQITSLPNQPVLNSGIGWNEPQVPASTIQVVQTSSSEFTFDYTMPNEGDYVFSYFGTGYFDGAGSWIGMPMNLPQDVVLAVNGPAGKKLKVEILDVNGTRKICYLALEGSFRNYTLDLLGLNSQQIAQIVFTAERSQMGAAGRVTVGVQGLLYIPVIPPSPVLTPADVTVLSNVRHLISIANPPATASVTPQSSSLYNLDYALPREGDWAVGLSSFDNFGTEVRETQDLNTLQNFVIGLRLASGSGRIKLEFEDVNRVKSFVYLSAVNTTEQFYSIPLGVLLAGNSRIDLSQIANVNVVVEKNSLSESAGQLQVRLGGQPYTPEVPEGWTRAASNVNYAFHVKDERVGSYTVNTLQLMDLRTGETQDVAKTQPPVILTISRYDVSADGNAVIYEMNSSMHVQKISDPSVLWVGGGIPKTITISEHLVEFVYTDGTLVSIDTQTFQRTVPTGWTRAASNPNFAYKLKFVTDPDTFNYFQLEVVELLSGKNVAVRKAVNRPGGEDFTGFVDVAPDGKYVVYEVAYARGSFPKTIEIFNLETQTVFSVLTGHATLIGVQFSATHIYVHTDAVEVDHVVRGMHIVDLTDGSQNFVPDVPSGWTRAASNVNYAFHVKDERVGSYTVNTLQLMDLRTGEMQDVAKTQPPVILTISRYDVSADGNAVIYEMNSYMHVQKISDPDTVWVGGGIPKTITLSGHFVEFVYTDGTLVSIDTQTFQRAVPEGWTRAASNVNYAFKIEKVGSYAQLRLLDIEAGKSQILIKRLIGRSNANPISGVYDVSPDGTTVIYGTSSVMYVQKIASPLKKLTLSGVLKSVSFIGQVAEITKTNGTRQWVNISTLKVVPRPIPSGWTVVPSLPTRAYQTITGNRVRVMDLWTGTVSEKPTSQNYSGIRSGLYYVMTSTGLKEIYSVRVGRGMVLRSYDPVTKRWASY